VNLPLHRTEVLLLLPQFLLKLVLAFQLLLHKNCNMTNTVMYKVLQGRGRGTDGSAKQGAYCGT
jgi:hypothetical protein